MLFTDEAIMDESTTRCAVCGFPTDDPAESVCGVCAAMHPDLAPPEKRAIRLRPYQEAAIDGVREAFERCHSTLAVMPTGTGKTILFAELIRGWRMGRVIVMAHRDELIRQAADKIERVTGEACDIEMGEYRADCRSFYDRAQVVVTSVQTMSRENRQRRFSPDEFTLLIVDEAHHAVSKSYLSVLEYFKEGGLKILGVTATPDRTDEAALGRVFDSVAYEYSMVDAIDDGWLVPVQQQFVHVDGLDFGGMKTTAGDLNQRQLADAMEEEKTAHKIVSSTVEIANGEQTLLFAASVDQAEQMAAIANRHKPGCADWICGDAVKCPMETRHATLRRFRERDVQFLFNCAVLLEGFDQDNIGVVVPKATKSRSLYTQMIGRGTRPLSGLVDGIEEAAERRALIEASCKPHICILDFVGNSGRHKLIHTGDVLGGNYDDAVVAEATRAVGAKSSRGERADMLAALREAEEARKKKMQWEREHIKAKATFRMRSVDPFDVFDIVPKREPAWHRGRPPTERMRAAIEKMGMPTARLTFWAAKQILDEAGIRRAKNLCSYKQAKVLRKHGFDAEVSFTDASATIDKIAKSGWTLKGPLTQGTQT